MMVNNEKTKRKVSALTITVCILLSLVLIFGAVFGIINIVRHANAVAYYGDTYINEGEMNFLSSYYKSLFMRDIALEEGVNAYDTPAFWEKTDKEGVKYGDKLKSGFRDYVSALLTAAAIYDSAASFSGDEKKSFNALCDEALGYLADGSEDSFNEATAEFGFDFDDFRSANVLLYKASMAQYYLFGDEGKNLIFESDMCMQYLETYTRVNLLFIRLTDKFVLDENGGFVYDPDGNAVTEPLTPSEIVEREQTVATITSLINKENGREMSPEAFKIYQESSDGDKTMNATGYYFNPNADATVEFGTEFPEVVSRAYEMEIGEYAMVECEAIGGVCFLYREPVAEGAYAKESDPFFSDFYSDAAGYLFPKTLEDLALEVTFKDSFDENAIISQKRNNKYYLRSFVDHDD